MFVVAAPVPQDADIDQFGELTIGDFSDVEIEDEVRRRSLGGP